jgi:hypothetical protein
MQIVCCCSIPTYQWSRRTVGYDHRNVPQNDKLI